MSSRDDTETENDFFPYEANAPAAIVFTVAFGVLLLLHIYQAASARTRYMLTIIFATVFQVLGYIFRYLVIDQNGQLALFIMSQVFIIVSPAIVAAQVYMIVGRMMSYVGPESTWISHSVITKLFVFLDIILIATQAGGSTILTTDNEDVPNLDMMRLGRTVLIAGLVAQVVAFGVFTIITIFFHRKSIQLKGSQLDVLKPMFWAFYVSSSLITVRSIFRTIEFAQIDFESNEPGGYLYVHEWPFYVLDSVPVAIATAVYNVWHPSKYLPRKKGERMDGTVEPPRKHWWSRKPKEMVAESDMELASPRGRRSPA